MKKFAIGCLLAFVLLAMGAAIVGYLGLRYLRSAISETGGMASATEMEKAVQNTTPFEAPASGELTEDQVRRLVAVQQAVRERMGTRFSELETKYKDVADRPKPSLPDIPRLVAAYRDLLGLWAEAKKTQVEALNAANFSLDEYRWVRRQSYRALGVMIADVDIGKIVEDVKAGRAPERVSTTRGSATPEGPEASRKAVERYRKQLEDNAPIASFGL